LSLHDGRGSLAHFAKLRQAIVGNGGQMKSDEIGETKT